MSRTSWKELSEENRFEISGRVIESNGPVLKVSLPGAAIGSRVQIGLLSTEKLGLVTGYNEHATSVVCYDGNQGLRPGAKVRLLPGKHSIDIPLNSLGLALSATGEILDGPISKETLNIPLEDQKIPLKSRSEEVTRFNSGVSAIDLLLPVAVGQRILICAEPGVGKTNLLTSLAESSEADVVVFALIGERGREAKEFISQKLSFAVRKKSTVIISTSDEPSLKRVLSAQVAVAVAEHYSKQGKNVLLLFDSLTRYLRAQRDLALASGELPVRRGYPASTFAELPKLLERAGNYQKGSITAFFTMLTGPEIDQDPMLEEVKGILDGHFILRRKIADRGVYPAISVSESLSRLASDLLTQSERMELTKIKRLFSRLESDRELALFAERLDPELELAIRHEALLEKLIKGSVTLAEVIQTIYKDDLV